MITASEFSFQVLSFFGSYPLLFVALSISFLFKAYLVAKLFTQRLRTVTPSASWSYIFPILICSMIENCAWLARLSKFLFFPNLDANLLVFIVRIAWAAQIIQSQSLVLFLESLLERNFHMRWYQQIFMLVSGCFCTFFIGKAFLNYHEPRLPFEKWIQTIQFNFSMFGMVLFVVVLCMWRLRSSNLPCILKTQLKALLTFVIVPFLTMEALQQFLPNGALLPTGLSRDHLVSLSTILLTYALYYCTRKINSLRFLNMAKHVQSSTTFNFIDDFKVVLEQLSHVTNISELKHITQTFFKDAFNIPANKTTLHIRPASSNEHKENIPVSNGREMVIENFVSSHENGCEIQQYLRKNHILIYDELDFNYFYDDTETHKTLVSFLYTINADIFLPIYEQASLIGYIMVERHTRTSEFYSNIERDEMVVFANYLGNIINLLQHRSLNILIAKDKSMQEELYQRHQEINLYKESMRSFLNSSPAQEIGIIFYKNRHFVFGNRAAKELIGVNINKEEGHPLTKTLKNIARQVADYKAPQTCFSTDADDTKLVIAGIPNLEQNNIIITVRRPDISDIIKFHTDYMKDPTLWDYVLYLETTRIGQLINTLIPGTGEILLAAKINLLKIALCKKAILIEAAQEDLATFIDLLHQTSMRETQYTLTLHSPAHDNDIAIRLFGVNPMLSKSTEQPLFKKLDSGGTLVIHNIHFLNLETQNYLAEYMRYGYYRLYQSDKKIQSTVRIICSTDQPLGTLVQEGTFSAALFNEIKAAWLQLPTLTHLNETELLSLVEGFALQALKTHDFKHLLELTDKEYKKIILHPPASLHELKNRVQSMLIQKSKKNQIYTEISLDQAFELNDPQLIEAARLGKHALRDQKIMAMLWDKFKNQNQIATLLGVNRSSINRRCKEYNLL